jgi:hypothetical protein
LEQASVETARRAQIGVLDHRVLSQPGKAQSSSQPLVVARRDLAVDQQAEPVLARLQRKLDAGADGIFTQPIFDVRLLGICAELRPR